MAEPIEVSPLVTSRGRARPRRATFPTVFIRALVATAVIWVAPAARSGPRAAEQAAARLDLSEACRLDEAQRAPEALAHLAPYVRAHPGDVAARSLLLNILLRRNWPLPIAEMGRGGGQHRAAPGGAQRGSPGPDVPAQSASQLGAVQPGRRAGADRVERRNRPPVGRAHGGLVGHAVDGDD